MAASRQDRDDTPDVPSDHQMLRNQQRTDTQLVEIGSPRPIAGEDSNPPSPHQAHDVLLLSGHQFVESSPLGQYSSNAQDTLVGSAQEASPRVKSVPEGMPNSITEGDHPAPPRGLKRAGTDSYQSKPHRPKDAPASRRAAAKDKVVGAEKDDAASEEYHDSHKQDSKDSVQGETEASEGKA